MTTGTKHKEVNAWSSFMVTGFSFAILFHMLALGILLGLLRLRLSFKLVAGLLVYLFCFHVGAALVLRSSPGITALPALPPTPPPGPTKPPRN